jgi:hypothetical protein
VRGHGEVAGLGERFRRRGWGLVVAALVVASGCAGSSRTADDYVLKAVNTAEAVHSAVETVRLGIDAAEHDRAFLPYLSRLFGDAEEDAGAAAMTFESVQPPDGASDALREELGTLLDAADDSLSAVRIAIRREDVDAVVARQQELADLSDALEAFITRNGG